MLFGITMFLNVWGVIWRNQKIVIGNAENVAAGGEANPEAPAAAKRAARASRCNTLFSIPCSGSWCSPPTADLLPSRRRPRSAAPSSTGCSCSSLWAFIEASALGFIGGIDSAVQQGRPSTSTSDTIVGGFILLAVICFVGWELLLPAVARSARTVEVGHHAGGLVAGDVAVELVVAGRQLHGARVDVADAQLEAATCPR